MKCDDARAAFLAGDADQAHVDHLTTCPACLEVAGELQVTLSVLDGEAVWEEPSASLRDRVVTLISGSQDRRPPIRRRPWWIAAAAVVAFVVGVAGLILALSRAGSPDWEVALPGTQAAPAASGTVQGWNEAEGTRLLFDIDGLDDAPPGTVYEVWFSRDNVHVSAGTFTASGKIEMWTGIARRDYPRIWITLEPIDTDESPSSVTVLDTG